MPSACRAGLALLKSIVLRNENFLPPLVAGIGGKAERAAYMKLTSTKNLLGRQGQRFLIFGRLGTSEDGRYVLEDADGVVGLDLEDAMPGEGIFTEGAFVLIEGEYTEEERIRVFALGHPPSETRDTARQICSQIDFLGSGAIPLADEPLLKEHEAAHDNLAMVFISELHLDHAKSLASFRAMLQGYADAAFIPFAFVLCGSFSAEPHKPAALARYQDAFAALGELLLAFPDILASSHFIFVPSSADPFSTSLLPRQPLPDLIADRLRSKVGPAAAARMHFTSNPTRLVYFAQEIVVSRDDTMTRMLRNAVRLKDEVADGDLKKFLVSTILDQVHLHPLPQSARPVLWEHDHALRLYPMPTALVLADKYDRFHLTYEGCRVFNPSSFRGASFGWTTYYPGTRVTESSELPQ
ncbi:hypothetical protein FA09DRAFT_119397 [Tilletiopsis washingtonensis]|uniref:DNA polymerase epsilon subunit B n=1 Tax=Tilletiopsis washingtonensis TaxID=58919 RepID=A0A316ZKT3_9BASI|nr:hypothetical protein FA09DRAFT_119397 [Tilletiopsis washingtonensis]PWO00924.1 hypothetical protein FA09DRAFT_119397 [Tilletiopsis washingtonensis]